MPCVIVVDAWSPKPDCALACVIACAKQKVGLPEAPGCGASDPGALPLLAAHEVSAPTIRRAVAECSEHRPSRRRMEEAR